MLQYLPTPYSYSAAVKAGDFVFLGLHRGKGDTFDTQLKDATKAMKKSLQEFDCDLDMLVKIEVYLKNIGDLGAMEIFFKDLFAEGRYPARMTTTTEFHDSDCLVMLCGIACADKDK
ncbi:RidA family protein [uncultured Cohaesibacter sp.]|uniref:RidA family protein n=1 Tax=uncultured Cohaesibacter sp. TaxID=1002546 RepID=UPI0029312B9F|nr:RidA family protein [uncultured Cohaesibacter sp.]